MAPRARVNGPPPSKEETWPPLQMPPPPLERRNTARAIDMGGGGVGEGGVHLFAHLLGVSTCSAGSVDLNHF